MSVVTRGRVVLGPCRCQGCGETVYWARWPEHVEFGNVAFRTRWREEDGAHHVCPNLPARLALRGAA